MFSLLMNTIITFLSSLFYSCFPNSDKKSFHGEMFSDVQTGFNNHYASMPFKEKDVQKDQERTAEGSHCQLAENL